MLTFTLIDKSSVQCAWGDKSVAAFPQSGQPDATVTLLPSPEDEPKGSVLSWPGEYDYSGIAIRGVGHDEGKKVSFAVEMDDVRIGFLAAPLQDMTDYELEQMGNIDVLVIPSGDTKLAQKLIDEIDPRILIPVEGPDGTGFDELLKIAGGQASDAVSEHKVKGLPAEGRTIVVLKK